jgi:hypothetical protein
VPAVLILLPQQHQQQPSSCPSQECTCPPWRNKAPFSMHAGRRMRVPPPSTRRTEYDADEAEEAGEPNNWLIGLLACWLVGLLACRLIGLLACWLVGFTKHPPRWMLGGGWGSLPPAWDERSTMPMKPMKSGSQTIGSSACRLVGSSARWLAGSLAHWLVGSRRDKFGLLYFFRNKGNPWIFFSHLFFFLIERLVQQQLVGLSTCLLVNLSTCWPITFFNELGIPLQSFFCLFLFLIERISLDYYIFSETGETLDFFFSPALFVNWETYSTTACWLVNSSACQLVNLSAYYILQRTGDTLAIFFCLFLFLIERISLDYYIFSEMGETLEFFSHLFFLLIERLVQQRLVGSSTCLLVNSSTC